MSSETSVFTGHRFGTPGYRRIRLALFLAALSTFALLYGIQPLLPTLTRDFALTPAEAALAMSLPAVALGAAMLVAGPLSEVVGRTSLIHASLISAALLGILSAVVPGWQLYLAVRTVQGVALAGLSAAAMAYLSEEIHHDSLARAAGLYVGGTALGGMGGRFLAGAMAQLVGWRGAVLAVAIACLGCAVSVLFLLPRSQGFRSAPADVRHLARTGLAVMRDPGMLVLFGIGCLSMGTFVGMFNAAMFRLESPEYGLPVAIASFVFVVHIVGSSSSAFAGKVADRRGYRFVTPLSAAVLLAGIVLTMARPLPLLVVGLALVSAGFFATHGVVAPWVAARAAGGDGGTAQATAGYLFFFYLGSSVFGALAPAQWPAGGWPAVVRLCGSLAAITIMLTLVMRRIPGRRKDRRPGLPATH